VNIGGYGLSLEPIVEIRSQDLFAENAVAISVDFDIE